MRNNHNPNPISLKEFELKTKTFSHWWVVLTKNKQEERKVINLMNSEVPLWLSILVKYQLGDRPKEIYEKLINFKLSDFSSKERKVMSELISVIERNRMKDVI